MAEEAEATVEATETTTTEQPPSWQTEMSEAIDGVISSEAGETTEVQPSDDKTELVTTEETPEVTATEKVEATEEEEPKDEFLDSIPEDSPSPDHWKNLRDQYKTLKKELRDSKASQPEKEFDLSIFGVPNGEQPAQPAVDPALMGNAEAAAAVPAPTQEQVSPEFVFETLFKIENGDEEDKYRMVCEQQIGQMKPQDILSVIDKAKSNQFGEDSAEIMSLARARLPEVQATWDVRKGQQDQATEWNDARIASVKEAGGMESMKNEEFAGSAKELNEWVPYLRLQANAPEVIREFQRLKGYEAKANRTDELEKENAELKTKLGVSNSPQPSGLPTSHKPGPAKTGEWKKEMAEALDELF